MLRLFKSLFASPERTGRRLHKDAVAVIQSDQQNGSADYLQRTADLVREELANIENRLAANLKNRDALIYDLRQRHQNARQQRDNALLTAMTLVLIYLRAQDLAEPGQSAIDTIDSFIGNPQER